MIKQRLMATASPLPLMLVLAEMDREALKRAPSVVVPTVTGRGTGDFR